MAPLAIPFLQVDPQPYVELRQAYVVTITQSNPTETYTSTVTLSTSLAKTHIAVVRTRTTQDPIKNPSNNEQGVIIGAVLRSFLGFLVLTLWWTCCYRGGGRSTWSRRIRRCYGPRYRCEDSDSSDSSIDTANARVRRRGCGFERRDQNSRSDWSRNDRHGHNVKYPLRAELRRERPRSFGASRTRSDRTSAVRRRRGESRRESHAFLLWALPGGNTKYSRRRRSRHNSGAGSERHEYRDRKGGLKFVVDD